MLPITQTLLTNRRNRPYLRNPKDYAIRRLKGVVAHWTANTGRGADARANRNYFNNTDRFASAHYIVDDHSIVQCLYDNEVAYHVGALKYKPDGDQIREEGLSPNYFMVGVEMCVNQDGNWNKTYRHSAELFAHLLHKHHFTVNSLYRHFDITGKDCPKMMLTDEAWSKFKTEVAKEMDKLAPLQIGRGRVNATSLNVRSGPGTNYAIVDRLTQGAEIRLFGEKDGFYYLGEQRWASARYVDRTYTTLLGRVNDPTGANVRRGPGLTSKVVDALPHRGWLYLTGTQGLWYELGPDRWVHSSVVDVVRPQAATVSAAETLNVRSGPGTGFRIVRRLKKGDRVYITDTEGTWSRIGNSEWVSSNYLQV